MVQPRLPELKKRAGVYYAVTDDGLELPIIDVTHPAFALAIDADEQRALVDKFMREQTQFTKLPNFVQRIMMGLFMRGSILSDGLRKSEGTFLQAIPTYLLKLPPDMLGGAYSKPVDRRIASVAPAISVRLRLQDMARLSADALMPALEAAPGRSLVFINIAGGPCMDNINALLYLKRERPELLAHRAIRIHVLDSNDGGPHFGERSLAALSVPNAPLHGVNVRFEHQHFDWSEPSGLRTALERAENENAITLGTSEGGLFEYGSDADILSILSEFRDGGADLVGIVGSVTRDDDVMKMLKRTSKTATRPRGIQVFERLCRSVGYEIARVIERPMCDDVVIRPQR